MSPPARRPYLRSEEARRRIVEAADAVFRRDGYARTTVGEIARAVGMTPANIYRHFPSKRAIAEHVCARYLGEACALMVSIARTDRGRAARIEAMLVAHDRYHREHGLQDPNMLGLVILSLDGSWAPSQVFRRDLVEAFASIVEDGTPPGGGWKSTAELALTVFDCVQAVMHPKILMEIPADQVEARIGCVVRLISSSLE